MIPGTTARIARRGLALALMMALAGQAPPPARALAAPPAPAATEAAYLLGPGDRISVSVLSQPEAEGNQGLALLNFSDVLVRPDGTIDLPLVGPVEAAGKSPSALAAMVTERFRRYYRSPLVTVNLSSPRTTISVTGAVRAGGTFTIYQPSVSFLKALSLGQGLSELADVHQARLIRAPERGGVVVVDLEKATRDGSIANLELQPGDAIYVPPRSRWDFDLPTIVGMVGTLASIITTILLITNRR